MQNTSSVSVLQHHRSEIMKWLIFGAASVLVVFLIVAAADGLRKKTPEEEFFDRIKVELKHMMGH